MCEGTEPLRQIYVQKGKKINSVKSQSLTFIKTMKNKGASLLSLYSREPRRFAFKILNILYLRFPKNSKEHLNIKITVEK